MADKNSRLAVLYQARKSLDQGNLPDGEKDELLKFIDILILSLEKYSAPEELENEIHTLAESIVSSQALLALIKQQADELNALKKLSLNLTSSLDLPTVLEAVVQEAMHLFHNARTVHIFLYANRRLEFGASLDSDGQHNRVFSVPRKRGLTYSVAREGKMILVDDMKKHPIYKDAPPEWGGSIVGIPLKIDKKVVGVMNLSRSNIGGFSKAELRLLNVLANQAAVAISNASLHQMISKKAYTDTTTGLPNRRALDERIETEVKNAWRAGTKFAVIMMDLDGFKNVNDTHGHDFGDQVLRATFNVIAVSVRATDFLARYGGDELTLILNQGDLQAARMVTEKILENMANFSIKAPDNSPVTLGISGGIAIYPNHGRNSSELLRAADAALYDAKKHRRGTFVTARAATGPLDLIYVHDNNTRRNGG